MVGKITLKTPQVLTVGKTFLHQPDVKTGERFPRMSKDGKRNLALKYKLKISLDPSNPEQLSTINMIQQMEEGANKEGKKTNTVLKHKMEKNAEGAFVPSERLLTIEFSSLEEIPVFEGGHRVGGDKLILDSKTHVTVEFEAEAYSFEDSKGDLVTGIKLNPSAINVLARPLRVSIPKNKLK